MIDLFVSASPNVWDDIITGITSSAIFLGLLYLLKPKVRISDFIACSNDITLNPPQKRYYFKVLNGSLFFKIYDIKVRVYGCINIPSHNGDDVVLKELELKKSNQWVIARMNYKHILQDIFLGDKRLNSRTDYAAQFSTYENLTQILNQTAYIRVEVLAKHSLTGFSIVKIKSYKHVSNIKQGSFNSGNSCKITE